MDSPITILVPWNQQDDDLHQEGDLIQIDVDDLEKLSRKWGKENSHNGEKSFKCVQCAFATVTKGRLKQHLATHTNVKPFKCGQCSYSAVTKGRLKQHLATHTNVKPFKCGQCTYAAVAKGCLKQHLAKHSGVKPC